MPICDTSDQTISRLQNEQKRDIIFNGGLSHLGRLTKYKKMSFMLLGCILTYFVYYMYLKSRLV